MANNLEAVIYEKVLLPAHDIATIITQMISSYRMAKFEGLDHENSLALIKHLQAYLPRGYRTDDDHITIDELVAYYESLLKQ